MIFSFISLFFPFQVCARIQNHQKINRNKTQIKFVSDRKYFISHSAEQNSHSKKFLFIFTFASKFNYCFQSENVWSEENYLTLMWYPKHSFVNWGVLWRIWTIKYRMWQTISKHTHTQYVCCAFVLYFDAIIIQFRFINPAEKETQAKQH